jgi:8-oxo-dGDP phosphatase
VSEFRKLAEREIHRWHVGRLVELDFEAPAGERFSRTVVRTGGAVSVVPVEHDADGTAHVFLLRQWRPSVERVLWEVPAGMRDKPGEDPAETGHRELVEEIGYTAGHLELLTKCIWRPVSRSWGRRPMGPRSARCRRFACR